MHQQDEVRSVVAREGVIARCQHPELAGAIGSLAAAGHLVSLLPGVYVLPGLAGDFRHRVLAATVADPDVVLVGETAARLTFWPTVPGSEIECAVRWDRDP